MAVVYISLYLLIWSSELDLERIGFLGIQRLNRKMVRGCQKNSEIYSFYSEHRRDGSMKVSV